MEKLDPKRHLEIEEEAKRAVRCPRPSEVKRLLFLTDEQFKTLLEVDSATYSDLMSGSKQLSHSQKLFLYAALTIAEEKGIIDKRLDY